MYSQLAAQEEKYVYFLMSLQGVNKFNTPSQQWFFVPVDAATGRISIMMSVAQNAFSESGVPISIDMTSKLDYLGSWWNGTLQSDPKLADWGPLDDHPIISVGIPTADVYYRPNALTPKPPSDFGYYYYDWYRAQKMKDMIPDNEWGGTGIHTDFKEMSIHDFLQYSVNHYVGCEIGSAGSEISSNILTFGRFVFGKSAINAVIDGGYTESDGAISFNVPLRADLNIRAKIEKSRIFIPATINYYEVTWDGDTASVDSDNSNDIYVDQSHIQWSAVSESGRHITQTISLTDDNGIPLPLIGANGEPITSDFIMWQDLLDALDRNKKVDILGMLKELKKAMSGSVTTGTPYAIQFNSNGTISLVPVS